MFMLARGGLLDFTQLWRTKVLFRSLTSTRLITGPTLTAIGVPIAEEIDLVKVRALVKHSSGFPVCERRFKEFHISKEIKNALLFIALHDGGRPAGGNGETSNLDNCTETGSVSLDQKQEVSHAVRVASSMSNFFVFGNGSVVFWNLNETERDAVVHSLRTVGVRGYASELRVNETERVDYTYLVDSNTRLIRDRLELEVSSTLQHLSETVYPSAVKTTVQYGAVQERKSNAQSWLELLGRQYAFSDALSSSVKLGIWEAQLRTLSEFNETLISDLESGKRIRVSRNALMRNVGELYRVRHFVNIASSTIDTPDVYWDLPYLEAYYARLKAYLSIVSRTRTLNEKLTLCCELADLLRAHLSDKHHTKLEWLIIMLIATEVCLAFAKHM